MKKLLLGNEAIARGAYEASVHVVSAYPGTPSTEISEYIIEYNEKVAAEVAIGASVAGGRYFGQKSAGYRRCRNGLPLRRGLLVILL